MAVSLRFDGAANRTERTGEGRARAYRRGRPNQREQRDHRRGSREALGQLFAASQSDLLALARRRVPSVLGSTFSAADLVQETFLEAKRSFSQFHGRTYAQFRAWLRQILLHNLADRLRRRQQDPATPTRCGSQGETAAYYRVRARTDSFAGSDCPYRCAVLNEEASRVEQAIGRLPEHYRRVILLRNHEGLPFAAVGERMGRSSEAARKLWITALRSLRRELTRCDGEPRPGRAV